MQKYEYRVIFKRLFKNEFIVCNKIDGAEETDGADETDGAKV